MILVAGITFERAARILPDIHQQLAKMAPAAAPASDVQQMHLWALSPREMTQLEPSYGKMVPPATPYGKTVPPQTAENFTCIYHTNC